MITLQIYRWILIVLILICILLLGTVFKGKNFGVKLRFTIIWVLILFILNFANMFYTLKYYDDNKDKVGLKGPKGDDGARGFRGPGFECSQCGMAGKVMPPVYASNINDYGTKVNDKRVKMGKCVFPFVHDFELRYGPVKQPRSETESNDAFKYGWCATSLNTDRTYKTYGYCNMSDIMAKKKEEDERRRQAREKYIMSNTGVLDVKLALGNRSSVKCPPNFTKVDTDLNYDAGSGKYIYICKKTGIGGSGIVGLQTVDESDNFICPLGYRKMPYDLNKDTGGTEVYLCKKKGNKNFLSDVNVQIDSDKCPTDFKLSSTNVNEGTDGNPVYICTTDKRTKIMALDAAFVWQNDKALYFFKGAKFWKYDPKKGKVDKSKDITQFWGKVPANIDAVFSYGYNGKTYFFKGDMVYLYDVKRQKIAAGYPKYIKNEFKGIPDNLDAVFTWGNDGKTYFIKGKFYYRYDDKRKRIERGYPKYLDKRFKNIPMSINAMFSYPHDGKTYVMRGDDFWILNKKDAMQSGYPQKINTKFKDLY